MPNQAGSPALAETRHSRGRVLYVVAHELSAKHLLRGQLAHMREVGYDVALVVSPNPSIALIGQREGVDVFPIRIGREIAVAQDIRSLWALFRLMRAWKPDLVNASTPKAGLLGMVAAWAARVPARLYVLRGLRLETTRGPLRWILSITERTTAACAHRVLCISESLRDRAVSLGVVPESKAFVIGAGSSNGVEVSLFTPPASDARSRIREQLGIPVDAPVIGYIGRMTRDKGIVELADAFQRLKPRVLGARLLLIGDFESGDPVPADTVRNVKRDPAIIHLGYVEDPALFYAAMDVLAFPSHREGFGNVCLEAAAVGRPVVGFRVTGVVDAVVNGETGALVRRGDTEALAEALAQYLEDPELRSRHGELARRRAVELFSAQRVWEGLDGEYDRMLKTARRRRPSYRTSARGAVILAATLTLALLSSLFIALVAAQAKFGRPFFFQQTPRAGLEGAPARVYELGLPELVNVFKGSMGIVGPRPLLLEYLDLYRPDQTRRHDVRPEINGWRQGNGGDQEKPRGDSPCALGSREPGAPAAKQSTHTRAVLAGV